MDEHHVRPRRTEGPISDPIGLGDKPIMSPRHSLAAIGGLIAGAGFILLALIGAVRIILALVM